MFSRSSVIELSATDFSTRRIATNYFEAHELLNMILK